MKIALLTVKLWMKSAILIVSLLLVVAFYQMYGFIAMERLANAQEATLTKIAPLLLF